MFLKAFLELFVLNPELAVKMRSLLLHLSFVRKPRSPTLFSSRKFSKLKTLIET